MTTLALFIAIAAGVVVPSALLASAASNTIEARRVLRLRRARWEARRGAG
ncbi:MAG: hypothetical protein HYV09_24820 [Deltaproteobacteria bacterium]|nr:hypothetical protein [Deltaproteobacteria bacterium]